MNAHSMVSVRLHQLYRADVVNETIDEEKFYFGLADTTFQETYRNHRDFKHEKYKAAQN